MNLSTPLQKLLADVVEVCGGSRHLIKIFNRLGYTSSSDAHDQLVTEYAEHQREKNVWSNIHHNTFTVASIDNIDMLQSYSSVYFGDQKRSYHGTTIQMVQPKPSLAFEMHIQAILKYNVLERLLIQHMTIIQCTVLVYQFLLVQRH